jgi:flagellar L-ring protein precursor FlgH
MALLARRHSAAPRILAVLLATTALPGCNALTRLSEVGEAPAISRIQDPTKSADYQPVSLPMPAPMPPPTAGANSLWRPGARGFFKDQRAAEIGDILTVAVSVTNSAILQNQTTQARNNSENAGAFALLGMGLSKLFGGASSANPWQMSETSSTSGSGTVNRQETVTVNLSAEITQRLPNGNLVISGKQEVRVNNELREVSVAGVIRPEDITSSNTIASDKIAEARITYGGRGTLSDIQQPRYGQQIFDIIAPF